MGEEERDMLVLVSAWEEGSDGWMDGGNGWGSVLGEEVLMCVEGN